MTPSSFATLALCAVTACGNHSDPEHHDRAPAPAPAPPPAPPVTPAPLDSLAAVLPRDAPPAFAAWDLPARARAWQGARVTEESLGSKIALDIHGAAAKQWDGKAETALTFALESPCSATLEVHGADGSTSATTSHYTVRGGVLVEGLGNAGSRKGKSAVACVSNRVLTLDDAGTCVSWTHFFGRWESAPGTCGFATKSGTELFTATIDNYTYELAIDGDALLDDQLALVSGHRYPDFAAARAALASPL